MVEEICRVVGMVVGIIGAVTVCFLLLWVAIMACWKCYEWSKRGRMLHTYIKEHPQAFLKWGEQYEKRRQKRTNNGS